MAGTMGRLTVGVSGLQTSQYSINTTAHNLMNTQTNGYSRQQVVLTDLMYNKVARDNGRNYKAGIGVVTAELKQARDNFADVSYREEYGRLNYYKAQYETVEEVENYFSETEGEDFNTTLDSLEGTSGAAKGNKQHCNKKFIYIYGSVFFRPRSGYKKRSRQLSEKLKRRDTEAC